MTHRKQSTSNRQATFLTDWRTLIARLRLLHRASRALGALRLRAQSLPMGRQRLLVLTVLAPIVAILLRVALFQFFDPIELLFIIAPAVVAGVSLFFLMEATSSQQRVVRSTSLALLIAASLLGKDWVGLVLIAPIFYSVMLLANTIDRQQQSMPDETNASSANIVTTEKAPAQTAVKARKKPSPQTVYPSTLAKNEYFLE